MKSLRSNLPACIASLLLVASFPGLAEQAGTEAAAKPEVSTFSLNGRVLERGTRRPLEGVNVFILPEGIKATTDASGNFKYQGLKSLAGEWIVNRAGYKRIKRKFQFKDSPDKLVLYLERNSYFEFETTVTAKSKKQDSAKTTLQQEEFLKAPGSGGDPIRALENLPGVLQSFDANVAIQGSPPEDTRYLIEGHEIPFIFHFFGLNTVAVPETVESIDFLAAGYAADYGRASSGIINLELRDPRTDGQHAMSYVDFTALGGIYEGPLAEDKSQSLFVGGRYSYIGELIRAGSEAFADEDDPPPTFN
ncbi:MAG: carboxypeptidase-like regulatory domain-containing protein, partial [Bdellovibrionales bacterium]|nr:carboxypeptidase-like regulatory domain-containing protein [Bdellovibrionales bacterium]